MLVGQLAHSALDWQNRLGMYTHFNNIIPWRSVRRLAVGDCNFAPLNFLLHVLLWASRFVPAEPIPSWLATRIGVIILSTSFER